MKYIYEAGDIVEVNGKKETVLCKATIEGWVYVTSDSLRSSGTYIPDGIDIKPPYDFVNVETLKYIPKEKKMKFKIGQKVIVTTDSQGTFFHEYSIGDIVEIISTDSEDDSKGAPYRTKRVSDGKLQWMRKEDLKPVKRELNLKVGDKVRIRAWTDLVAEFGVDSDGDVKTYPCVNQEMRENCGNIVTIKSVSGNYIKFEEIKDWSWTKDMVEEYITEKEKTMNLVYVNFPEKEDEKSYLYEVPHTIKLSKGDKVYVTTSRASKPIVVTCTEDSFILPSEVAEVIIKSSCGYSKSIQKVVGKAVPTYKMEEF